MKTHEIKTWTIDEHPEQELCYEWIRENWYDLGQYSVEDAIDTINGFCSHFDVTVNVGIGLFSDAREGFKITFSNDEAGGDGIEELSGVRLWKYLENNYLHYREWIDRFKKIHDVGDKMHNVDLLAGDCPFTGMSYDEAALDEIREFMKAPDERDFQELLTDCVDAVFKALHDDGDYIYSDEGLREMCEAYEYDFLESGEVY